MDTVSRMPEVTSIQIAIDQKSKRKFKNQGERDAKNAEKAAQKRQRREDLLALPPIEGDFTSVHELLVIDRKAASTKL